MTWLAFIYALELGFLPAGDFVMYGELDPEYVPVQYSLYTDLQVEFEISNIFFIGGGIKTGLWYGDGYTFFPHRSTYSFYTGFRYGLFEVGWRHFCFHPITPFFGFGILDYNAIWEGAYDELYLKISGRIN